MGFDELVRFWEPFVIADGAADDHYVISCQTVDITNLAGLDPRTGFADFSGNCARDFGSAALPTGIGNQDVPRMGHGIVVFLFRRLTQCQLTDAAEIGNALHHVK